VAASNSFPPSTASPVGDAAESSMFDVPSLHYSSPATTQAIGSDALPPRFSASCVDAGGPPLLDDMASYYASLVTSTSTLPSTTPPPSPMHRLIFRTILSSLSACVPRLICYANFYFIGEPESVQEAITDLRWKQAKDLEYSPLL
jgi:hypothetical protein